MFNLILKTKSPHITLSWCAPVIAFLTLHEYFETLPNNICWLDLTNISAQTKSLVFTTDCLHSLLRVTNIWDIIAVHAFDLCPAPQKLKKRRMFCLDSCAAWHTSHKDMTHENRKRFAQTDISVYSLEISQMHVRSVLSYVRARSSCMLDVWCTREPWIAPIWVGDTVKFHYSRPFGTTKTLR